MIVLLQMDASNTRSISGAPDSQEPAESGTNKQPNERGRVEDTGGQITLFSKSDCPFCVKLKTTVSKLVDKVLANNPDARLEWKVIDSTGVNASLCVRLTGSFSVPHLFFNEEYIGDCSTTVKLCEEQDDTQNVILTKLTKIATGPKLKIPFPPSPDATIVKITDEFASSAQPSIPQLSKMGSSYGFASVVNLLSPMESSYIRDEENILKTAGIHYLHQPLVDLTVPSITMIVKAVKIIPKPALIHCDTSQRALMVALLLATEGDSKVTAQSFLDWGKSLSIDLTNFASVAARVASALRSGIKDEDGDGQSGTASCKRMKPNGNCECDC